MFYVFFLFMNVIDRCCRRKTRKGRGHWALRMGLPSYNLLKVQGVDCVALTCFPTVSSGENIVKMYVEGNEI